MPVPTPQEMFGFGSVPLTSYFKTSPGASQDTRFSPAARMLFAQQEEMQREQEAQQRKQQAEQLANQILGGAGGMTDRQLDETLINTPAAFGGGVEGLGNYRRFRQQVAPSQADEKLGPFFLNRIKDPYHAERFQRRMLEEGYSANDAWEAYRDEEQANTKAAISLAEAGVPDNEIEMFKVNGIIDPVAAARHVAKINQEKSLRTKANDPIDQKLDLLKDAMAQMKVIVGDEDALREDPRFKSYAQEYQNLVEQKRAKFAPAAGGAAAAPAGKPSAFLQNLQGIMSVPVKKP